MLIVLLFGQLHNETRQQEKQTKKFFHDLVIDVYYPIISGRETLVQKDNVSFRYPVLSTSITCGKRDYRDTYQLDLPIDANDKDLADTSAEITIEPDGFGYKMYIRRLQQPYIWVADTNNNLHCVSNKYEKTKTISGKIDYSYPQIPDALRVGIPQRSTMHDKSSKINLCLNDRILLGNTLLVITYDGGKK